MPPNLANSNISKLLPYPILPVGWSCLVVNVAPDGIPVDKVVHELVLLVISILYLSHHHHHHQHQHYHHNHQRHPHHRHHSHLLMHIPLLSLDRLLIKRKTSVTDFIARVALALWKMTVMMMMVMMMVMVLPKRY